MKLYSEIVEEAKEEFEERRVFEEDKRIEPLINKYDSFSRFLRDKVEIYKHYETIEYDNLSDEVYVILRKGNYVPKWMLEGIVDIDNRDVVQKNYGYYKGTAYIQENPKSLRKDWEEFKKILEEYPELADEEKEEIIWPSDYRRDEVKRMVLTGLVAYTPNGLYVKKGDLREVCLH